MLSDSPSIVEVVARILTEAQIKVNWQQATTLTQYDELLKEGLDIVLYDAQSTQLNLSEAISCLLNNHREIPLIVINGESRIRSAVAAIQAGATDYIALDELAQLPTAIAKTITEPANCLQICNKQSEQQLEKLITENADGIIVVGDRGIVQFINPAALKLLGKIEVRFNWRVVGFSRSQWRLFRSRSTSEFGKNFSRSNACQSN